MRADDVVALALSLTAIALVAWQMQSLMEEQGIRIEGVDGLIAALAEQLGLPVFLAAAASYFLRREKRGKAPIAFLIVTGLYVMIFIVVFVFAFLMVMMGALIYAGIVSWIIDAAGLSGTIDSAILAGWIFFFFVAEFFLILTRKALTQKSLEEIKQWLITGFREGDAAARSVIAVHSAALAVVYLKLLGVFLWLAIFFGNAIDETCLAHPLTALLGFIFTTGGLIIFNQLFKRVHIRSL